MKRATERVEVHLRVRLANCELVLTATTPAMGESYQDSWSVSPSLPLVCEPAAAAMGTGVHGSGTLVSRATVAIASLAPDTTYTFTYAVVLGSCARTWAGSASATVAVGSDGALSFP